MHKLDLKASLEVFGITFFGFFYTFRNICYFRNTDFQDHFRLLLMQLLQHLEQKQILLQSSNVSGMQKLSVGIPGMILIPPELSASVLRYALSPSLQDCLTGGNSQCPPRHQACSPEVFTFSLYPPSGCCKLHPGRRLPTVQFVSSVKSIPTTIRQAFSVPCCPSRHVTVLTYHRIAKENSKTGLLRKQKKKGRLKGCFLTQTFSAVNPFRSSKLLQKLTLLCILQGNASFTHVKVTILLFKNLHIFIAFLTLYFHTE